jgi:hypothetical protein
MPTTLTTAEAKLFLALLNGEVPNLAWIMEGGDPFYNFLEKYDMSPAEFEGLFTKLRHPEPTGLHTNISYDKACTPVHTWIQTDPKESTVIPMPFLATLEALRTWQAANPGADAEPFVKAHGWNYDAFAYECDRRARIPTDGWNAFNAGYGTAFYSITMPAMTIELEDDGSAWYVARGLKIKGEFPTFVKAVAHVRSLA